MGQWWNHIFSFQSLCNQLIPARCSNGCQNQPRLFIYKGEAGLLRQEALADIAFIKCSKWSSLITRGVSIMGLFVFDSFVSLIFNRNNGRQREFAWIHDSWKFSSTWQRRKGRVLSSHHGNPGSRSRNYGIQPALFWTWTLSPQNGATNTHGGSSLPQLIIHQNLLTDTLSLGWF